MNDGPFETFENEGVTFLVLGNDRDPDGDAIRVLDAVSRDGAVTINADGTLSFTPAPGFAGTAVVTYVVTDDQGGTSTATAAVMVRPQNVSLPMPPATTSQTASVYQFPSIEVDGAVVAAVNGRPGNGTTAGLGGLDRQDQSLSLGGEPAFGFETGAVLQESARINQLWLPNGLFAANPLRGDWNVESISGFSLRFGVDQAGTGGAPRFVVESIVRDGVLVMTFDEHSSGSSSSKVVGYRVTRPDGRVLPDWLERPSIDLLQGRPAVTMESLELRITAILADGTESSQDVRIDLSTGEIQPLHGRRADVGPPLFMDQFRAFAQLSDNDSAALATALGE